MAEISNARTGRSPYLLDGRRVTISNLVDSGLLPVGSTLRFRRPRKGDTFSAEVTVGGGIALADGREFRSHPPTSCALTVSWPARSSS
ncbi:MAG: hypothetical protein ACRDRO_29855 [Pseudonocardiaceae bacterium]